MVCSIHLTVLSGWLGNYTLTELCASSLKPYNIKEKISPNGRYCRCGVSVKIAYTDSLVKDRALFRKLENSF